MSKFGFFLAIALVAIELTAMRYALANKTQPNFSVLTRKSHPLQTDTLGNVIYQSN